MPKSFARAFIWLLEERKHFGLNIKNEPASGSAAAAGSWNSMCTHRIKIESELGEELNEWIRKAYDAAG